MRDEVKLQPIRNLLEACWPGEWGTDPVSDQGSCVVYRATDIDDDGHLRLEGGAERDVLPSKLAAKSLRPNDILLEASGGAPDRPVGRVALVSGHPRKAALTSNFFRLMRPRSTVDSRFLTLQLVALNRSSAIWRYQQQTTGLINLKVADYLGHAIWTPALGTQRKIADVIDCIDTTIEKTAALIAKHQQIKAGLMHDLFTRGVLPNGQLRPPRSEAPKLYQETAIGWIPRDWAVAALNDKVNPARPIVYGILMPGYGHPGGVPVVKVKDIRDRSIDVANLLLTSPAIDQEYRRSRLKGGDVLFTIRGTVGRVSLVPAVLENANITQDTARIDLLGVSNTFISLFFESSAAKRFFEINTLGVAVQGINLGELRKLPIPVPSQAEQEAITTRLLRCLDYIKNEVSKKRKLENQKLGLMQDLLTGRVPVPTEAAA